MTPKPEIFRYATECDAPTGKPPAFQDAERFSYDTFEHGTPTTAKLARVAAERLVAETSDLFDTWSKTPLRFWLWRDDGQPYGSIEVELDFQPMVTPLGSTLIRTTEHAA